MELVFLQVNDYGSQIEVKLKLNNVENFIFKK
jgi:hypothetical protein